MIIAFKKNYNRFNICFIFEKVLDIPKYRSGSARFQGSRFELNGLVHGTTHFSPFY